MLTSEAITSVSSKMLKNYQEIVRQRAEQREKDEREVEELFGLIADYFLSRKSFPCRVVYADKCIIDGNLNKISYIEVRERVFDMLVDKIKAAKDPYLVVNPESHFVPLSTKNEDTIVWNPPKEK